MKVYSIDGITPVVDPTAFVHPSAVLIGDVIVGPGAYVGPSASLRGDFGRLVIGRGANVQDCCIVHGFPDRDTVIEEDGHIGHGAVIHGATVARNAMVGINAVVNDNAVIGDSAIVAALAFVKAETVVPPRTLVAGIPARVKRELTEAELVWKRNATRLYQELTERCRAGMREAVALSAVEADRRRLPSQNVMPLSEYKSALARETGGA
ncbi:MAG: transferase hexapeptide repeat family protein [Burkholderiales bacterium]|nr:transferase hexapeptide repeat family protein [Burkholderiales bacterium]